MNWKIILPAILSILCWNLPVYAVIVNDTGAINQINVFQVIQVKSESDIEKAISLARKENRPISIMAVQHSQGGQTLIGNGIVLDMLSYNHVIDINLQKKQITVQSGMTWDALQQIINPYHLSVKVMQDSYIFSIGGALSANVHGEDFRSGPIDHTVVGFHLILANGKKVWVTHSVNSTLFQAVLGGYGTLGVISDITLQLTNNDLLQGYYYETDINHFVPYFQKTILPNPQVSLFYGRLDINPGEHFLRDMYLVTSTDTHILANSNTLNDPENMDFIITPLFDWSRHDSWGKSVRWTIEKEFIKEEYGRSVSPRNNIMRKAILFATNHYKPGYADWLQEYFIPVDQFPGFIDELRRVARDNNIDLLNAAVRYIPKDGGIILPYAKENCFSVVLYFEQSLSPVAIAQAKMWTQRLIQAAIERQGTYYLTYQGFATQKQFESAYPGYQSFNLIKKEYDPNMLFTNTFYNQYFLQ